MRITPSEVWHLFRLVRVNMFINIRNISGQDTRRKAECRSDDAFLTALLERVQAKNALDANICFQN